jgi:flagellar motor switch protein FliM
MAADSQIQNASEAPGSTSEVERLLAEVASQTAADPPAAPYAQPKETVAPCDLCNSTFLSPHQLRKFQSHQEKFVQDLAVRLSVLLRSEVGLKLAGIQTVSYRRLEEGWAEPAHLTLFKAEPLRGHGVLQIPARLGLTMVERLLGGVGSTGDAPRQLSEIENGLLEQIVQIILGHWCGHWSKLKELKPVILGCEISGRFIQATSAQTNMLAVCLLANIGELQEQIQIGLPYLALEPLIRQLAHSSEASHEAPAPPPAAASKWNRCFDEVSVRLSANWPQLEVAAGDVLQLKVGDILRLNAQCAQKVTVHVADLPKFNGRLGTSGGKWAVELTQLIKS